MKPLKSSIFHLNEEKPIKFGEQVKINAVVPKGSAYWQPTFKVDPTGKIMADEDMPVEIFPTVQGGVLKLAKYGGLSKKSIEVLMYAHQWLAQVAQVVNHPSNFSVTLHPGPIPAQDQVLWASYSKDAIENMYLTAGYDWWGVLGFHTIDEEIMMQRFFLQGYFDVLHPRSAVVKDDPVDGVVQTATMMQFVHRLFRMGGVAQLQLMWVNQGRHRFRVVLPINKEHLYANKVYVYPTSTGASVPAEYLLTKMEPTFLKKTGKSPDF